MANVTIDTKNIVDSDSFHRIFAEALDFPDYYGRNMDAWIDVMSDLGEENGQIGIALKQGKMLHLCITDANDFARRQPELMRELLECTAFVNSRFVKWHNEPKISLILIDGHL